MEEELLRSESKQVRVLHEAFALRSEVVFGEMRKRSLVEAERNSLTFDVLLSDASHDLGDVDRASL